MKVEVLEAEDVTYHFSIPNNFQLYQKLMKYGRSLLEGQYQEIVYHNVINVNYQVDGCKRVTEVLEEGEINLKDRL